MTPSTLEAWVLRVVDQVTRGEHGEDSRVELKREWPKPANAARLIAGHANAARGASILWIIGLDESTGVHGAPVEELANWYGSVKQSFDGLAPTLCDLNVVVGDKTLVALLFDTDRAPYVVRNPVYGSTGGGSVEREVPWREGRSTFSARREHLVRLLVPTTKLPDVETLFCGVKVSANKNGNTYNKESWYLRGALYLTPDEGKVVIPFHRAKLLVTQGLEESINSWQFFRMFPPNRLGRDGSGFISRVDSETVNATSSEVIISGPGKVFFEASTSLPFTHILANTALEVRLTLSVVKAEIPLSLSILLAPTVAKGSEKMVWSQGDEN